MEKCSTCKYYQPQYGWRGDDDGNCSRLGSNDLLIFDAKQNQFIAFNKDSNPQSVHVGKNFGCVLHKPINEEKVITEDED